MNLIKIAAVSCLLAVAGCTSEEGACERIVEACHEADPGSGPIHDCHEDAEAPGVTDAICAEREDDCHELCEH
jgi:hypothetical protein